MLQTYSCVCVFIIDSSSFSSKKRVYQSYRVRRTGRSLKVQQQILGSLFRVEERTATHPPQKNMYICTFIYVHEVHFLHTYIHTYLCTIGGRGRERRPPRARPQIKKKKKKRSLTPLHKNRARDSSIFKAPSGSGSYIVRRENNHIWTYCCIMHITRTYAT